jgi:hypothetical protein
MDLTLEFKSEEEGRQIFEPLSEGGMVKMPLNACFGGRCSVVWKIRSVWFGRYRRRLRATNESSFK